MKFFIEGKTSDLGLYNLGSQKRDRKQRQVAQAMDHDGGDQGFFHLQGNAEHHAAHQLGQGDAASRGMGRHKQAGRDHQCNGNCEKSGFFVEQAF